MGLLSKLKSMLGIEESGRASGSGVDVTVEREPGDGQDDAAEAEAGDAGGEEPSVDSSADDPAAAGSDAAASTESLVDDEGTDDTDRAAEPAEAAGAAADEAAGETENETEAEQADESDDLTAIKGVGPAYADRLNEAGITTFADLADADPDDLAAETDLSPKRVGRWIDRAADR